MSTRERFEHWILYAYMWPARIRRRRDSRQRRAIRASAIATTRSTLGTAGRHGAASIQTVFNVGLYLLLVDGDLAEYTDDIVCARDRHRRRFVAKHLAALLYEVSEDLPQMLGRRFRTAVAKLEAPAPLIGQLNTVTSALAQFWQENREPLKGVRNAVAAHREHNALQYLEALEALEPLDIMRRGVALSAQLGALIGVLSQLGELTRDPRVIIRDILPPRESAG